MDSDRWKRLEELFQTALELDSEKRQAFVDEQAAGDPELAASLAGMLEAHADEGFLETPAAEGLIDAPGGAEDVELAPERIGQYEVTRRLGAGGMGEVWLASHRTEDVTRDVAIKVVKRGMDTEEVLRRFSLERRILAGLVHPNVAQFHEAGATDDGRPFFVMEYVDGERIDRFADDAGLELEQRLRLFLDACSAVDYAHRNLIVHRDIKPSNVLVSREGTVKLVDFGIGRVLSPDADETHATRTHARRLTPDYSSPELIRGEPTTTAADVYALGVLLYELLAGRTPWADESGRARLSGELDTAPTAPSAAADGGRAVDAKRLKGDLDTIVLTAIHPDPSRRYVSVAALAEDLERHLDGRPVLARGDSIAYRGSRFVRRNRWGVATAAAVAAGLVAVAVTATIQSQRVADERDKARAVQSFLLESFGATTAEGSDSTTVRELLDRQAQTVRAAYADSPELLAEMQMVLADAYQRLGLHSDALPLAEEGLSGRQAIYSGDHADIAYSMTLLGWIRHQTGDSESAIELLEESVAMYRRLGSDGEAGLARALNDVGSVYDQLGRIDDAEPALREALALRLEQNGPADMSVAITSSNLAALMYRMGDYRAADSLGSTALEALRVAVGPDHQRTFIAQSNLATFRWVAGDLEGAAEMYEEMLQSSNRLEGGRNARTASTSVTYASLLRAGGDDNRALELLQEALAIQEEVLPEDHRDIAESSRLIGAVLLQNGRPTEGLQYMERALAVSRAAYGEEHPLVAEATEGIAVARAEQGRWPVARQLFQEAVTMFAETLGEQHPRFARASYTYSTYLLQQGNAPEAVGVVGRACDAIAARENPPENEVSECARRLEEAQRATLGME